MAHLAYNPYGNWVFGKKSLSLPSERFQLDLSGHFFENELLDTAWRRDGRNKGRYLIYSH